MLGALVPPANFEDEFDVFAWRHNKHYAHAEEKSKRRSQFYHHKRIIEEHNSRPDVTFSMAMNHLGDMTQEEIENFVHPLPTGRPTRPSAAQVHVKGAQALPDTVNWVEKGAVNPPKDQGICGSCWTFGTAAAIEGAWAVKFGHLPSLSEQQLVDCAWLDWANGTGNLGCDGGFAASTMQWVIDNGGMASEHNYKYLMQDHWCNAHDLSGGIKLQSYANVSAGEDNLQSAVVLGPVSVAIDATYPTFTFYPSGVYYNPTCKSDPASLDHEVVCVGYGTDTDGQDYWLVKNSWSTYWGDGGFVKMARNHGNNCGIATQGVYAIV